MDTDTEQLRPLEFSRWVNAISTFPSIMKVRAFPTKIWRISFSSSPRDEGVGRGPRRGANQNAPPLPDPFLHRMEEREWLRLRRVGFISMHPWFPIWLPKQLWNSDSIILPAMWKIARHGRPDNNLPGIDCQLVNSSHRDPNPISAATEISPRGSICFDTLR